MRLWVSWSYGGIVPSSSSFFLSWVCSVSEPWKSRRHQSKNLKLLKTFMEKCFTSPYSLLHQDPHLQDLPRHHHLLGCHHQGTAQSHYQRPVFPLETFPLVLGCLCVTVVNRLLVKQQPFLTEWRRTWRFLPQSGISLWYYSKRTQTMPHRLCQLRPTIPLQTEIYFQFQLVTLLHMLVNRSTWTNIL